MTRRSEIHPLLSFAIEATGDEDRVALQHQLREMIHRESRFRVEISTFEGGLTVCGEDELQLVELSAKLGFQHKAKIGELAIRYKETIRDAAEAEGKYFRQTGGLGNYGHCKIRLEPKSRGEGYKFVNGIEADILPTDYVEAVDQGIRSAMEAGILAGYPLVDITATLFDGSYHQVDSNQMAFRIAASIAFKEAARRASPMLLEPVMIVEVAGPEEFTGTSIRDIKSRRGRIEGMKGSAGSRVIRAIIPLAEMLTTSSHGRAEYPMQFGGYEPAPTRYGDFGDDAAAFAKRPSSPKPGTGSAAAEIED